MALVTIRSPMPIMNRGQRVSNLNHPNTSSRRVESPKSIRNPPKTSGHVVLPRPPKQSSSMSQSLLLYIVGDGFSDTPQFEHSVASSSFSVPHFVQYTKINHSRKRDGIIQRLLKNMYASPGAPSADPHMVPLAGPNPGPYPEHRHGKEVHLDPQAQNKALYGLEHEPRPHHEQDIQ